MNHGLFVPVGRVQKVTSASNTTAGNCATAATRIEVRAIGIWINFGERAV